MNILHVQGEYFPEGGAETYLRGLAAAQRGKGHRVGILYNSEAPATGADRAHEFFCPPSFGLRSGFRHGGEVLRQIRNWRPDLLHLHVTQYRMSPYVIRALGRRLPMVQTVHDTLFLCLKGIGNDSLVRSPRILPDAKPCLKPVGHACIGAGCVAQLASAQGWAGTLHGGLTALYRVRACRAMDRLLVNSEFTRAELLRNGFSGPRIALVGIAADFPREWEQALDDPIPVEEGALPEILFVGKLVQAKGVLLLLDALARLAHHPWQAVLVGSGSESPRIKEYIAQHGWTDRVRVEAGLDRVQLGRYYRRARLLVFPSLWPESWGLVGVEAMRMGCPVVAFDSGAVGEWLEDGVTGYRVPAGDLDQLGERIERLLLDPCLARRMGQAARTRAERYFRANAHVERVLDVYRDVLAEQRASEGKRWNRGSDQ